MLIALLTVGPVEYSYDYGSVLTSNVKLSAGINNATDEAAPIVYGMLLTLVMIRNIMTQEVRWFILEYKDI